MKFTHYLEVELNIEADVEPYQPGGRDEPSSGPRADITSVKINGIEVPLQAFIQNLKALEEAAIGAAADQETSARDEAADRKFEEMRDERRKHSG